MECVWLLAPWIAGLRRARCVSKQFNGTNVVGIGVAATFKKGYAFLETFISSVAFGYAVRL